MNTVADDAGVPGWRSARELDIATGTPKGSAFRAFRRIEARWREGEHYRVLHHEHDRAAIEALRAAGRIYASTVNLVLFCPALADAVVAQIRRMTTEPTE